MTSLRTRTVGSKPRDESAVLDDLKQVHSPGIKRLPPGPPPAVIRYALWRSLATLPMLLGVMVGVFLLMNVLPGDPVDVILGREGGAMNVAARDELRQRLRLDAPIAVRFGRLLRDIAQGDLGRSIWSNQPVADLIVSQIGSTAQLAGTAIGLAILLGLPIGVVAATRANSILDLGIMSAVLVAFSTPNFLLGVLLLLTFSYWLGWIPIVAAGGLVDLVLPAVALGVPAAAAIARVTRSAMLDVLTEGYVRTARAKGLGGLAIPLKHALRNALIPVVTLVGFYVGYLVTGTVVVETVFSRPGVGRVVVQGILQRDLPVVQAVVLLGALVFIGINLVLDLVYAWLDPRISYR